MNQTEKKQGQEIFLDALEIKNSARDKFIKRACNNQQNLVEYVYDLIKAHERSNQYFDELEQNLSDAHLNEIENHLFQNKTFGQYKVVNILKQGGMGTVFLGKRADGEFERDVVIKMLPIDMDFTLSQQQFAHEKEILASLSHPNIVQLYDSGITEQGQSYFVMELINGQTIIQYCHDQKLNIKQRLKLFNDISRAVAYAHQHLIIHGDIKPSNVMVNEEGQVKLLDFGIARLVNKNSDKAHGYSLNYLTPEHKNQQAIVTSTDIHQLGQLLLELLTGVCPKELRDSAFNFSLLSKIEQQFSKKDKQKVAFYMHETTGSLTQVYHSDLQYIIAKMLKYDSFERYDSVASLIDDIKRYQNNYCISTQNPTLLYHSKKYLQRNPFFSLFIVTLLVFSIGFAYFSQQHNKKLAIERDKAIKVKNLITDVFNAADPSYAPGKELTATEVLDLGLQRLRERFDEESDIEADLMVEIAQTYQSLGKYEKADKLLHEAFESRLNLQPKNQLLHAKTMLLLGENARLMSQNKQALQWLQKSLSIFTKKPQDNNPYIASAQSKLGRVLVLLGQFPEAENKLKKATKLTQSLYGEQSFEYAQALNDLNSVYFRQGKYHLVEQLLLKTKAIREYLAKESQGPILDKDYATNINNLGLAYYLQGKLSLGEKYFKQAVTLRQRIFSKPHPEQAQSLTNLGLLLNDSGKPSEALHYIQQALKIREQTLQPGHLRINDAWNNLALVYHENGQFDKAIEIYEKLIQPIVQSRGKNHSQTSAFYTNMANTYLELNNFDKAQFYFQKSLDNRIKSLPDDHLYLSYSYIGLGRTEIALGEISKGKSHIEKALQIRQKKLPKDHWLLGEALYAKAMVNYIQGNADIDLTNRACEILLNKKGEGNILTQKCQTLLQKVTDRSP